MAEGKAGFHNQQDSRILDKASSKSGKLDKQSPLAKPPKQPFCPQCGSTRLYKDGLRYLKEANPCKDGCAANATTASANENHYKKTEMANKYRFHLSF